jgi:plasmid stabilization system protein ParE
MRRGIFAHGNSLIVFESFDEDALIPRVLHSAREVPGVVTPKPPSNLGNPSLQIG